MRNVRRLGRLLPVAALIASGLALAAAPTAAQTNPRPTVFTFRNDEATATSNWEVRVTATSFGGCGRAQGRAGGSSTWLGAGTTGDEWGIVLDLNCTYTFTGTARNESTHKGQLCDVALAWGTSPAHDGPKMLATNDTARRDQTRVSVVHKTGNGAENGDPVNCSAAITATFRLDPDTVVQNLPTSAADENLELRAERAVEATTFDVRVHPDPSTKNRTGCDTVLVFELSGGDDGEVEKPLPGIPSNASCKFRATIHNPPAPFQIVDADGILRDTSDANSSGNIVFDLSSIVRLPYGRIAIIQDVTGSGNQGHASYEISRTCAGAGVLPPNIIRGGGAGVYTLPGGAVVATLSEGRFTVHSPNFANFGASANYLAVARSTTSSAVDGCSVSVTISDVPGSCTVAPSRVQSKEWSRSAPFDHFDFEFDITCNGASASPTPGLPPLPPEDGGDSDSASDDVRIVARKLANGKIEFGLQQRQDDDVWGDRRFPAARLFPADTAVGRWLVSSAIELSVAESAEEFVEDIAVRIVARKRDDGRVEFGLQQRDNGSWGERILPQRRYFPPSAAVDRWLGSSTIDLDT